MKFGFADYAVFALTLLIFVFIGTYQRFTGGKQKTNEEYLLGNRNQNPVFVAVSLMSSFMSPISILGGAAETYNYGTQFFTMNIGYQIGIMLALYFYIPVFLKLESVSMYQYLELRFGKFLKVCTSAAFVIQMVFYMSIVLVAPSIALQIITQMSYTWCIIIVGLVCTLYSTLGGIKAVIYTDLFQGALMFMSLFCIFINAYRYFGSFSNIFEIAREHGRIEFTNSSLDPTVRHTVFSTLVGGIVQSISLNGINQTQIQRYRTLRNRKSVKMAALIFGPILVALSLCIMLAGLIVFARYHDCDPVKTKQILTSDQLLPFYVIDNFTEVGLSGLFVAGIFSAALSTISPLLNSLAAVTLDDFIKPIYFILKKRHYTSSTSVVPQFLSLSYGILCIIIALLTLNMKSILTATIIVFNVVGGPVLGIFSLGIFMPWANQWGTIIGFIAGVLSSFWISTAQTPPPPIILPTSTDGCSDASLIKNMTTILPPVIRAENYPYLSRISYMFYGLLGLTITFLVGTGASIVLRRSNEKVKPQLLHKSISKKLIEKKSNLILLEDADKTARAPLSD